MIRFEWDEVKSRANLAKHKISFETAVLVFDDPYQRSNIDRVVDGEQRWQTLGMIGDGMCVLVAQHIPGGSRRRGDPDHLGLESDFVREESL